MVGRTTLKPRASLCELFYFFVLEFILSTLKLPLAINDIIEAVGVGWGS